MRQRCYDPKRDGYRFYGGKGVSVCEVWRTSFVAFEEWANANGYNGNLSIDRIDHVGNYTPENCRWSTPKQQATNRSCAKFVTVGGVRRTVGDWAKVTGIGFSTLYKRHAKGVNGQSFIAYPLVTKSHRLSK